MMARKKRPDPNFIDGKPRCVSVIRDSPISTESHRCTRSARPGSLLCTIHQKQRDRLEWNRRPLVITMSFKPRRRTLDGGYKKTIVGRLFDSREEADDYMRLLWGSLLFTRRPGERLVSMCVEPWPHGGKSK